MTKDSKQTQDIGLTVIRGNNGANKGMNYTRQPASYDESRLFGEIIMSVLKILDIPVYKHVKSNHVYSYRQKIAILVFMSAEGLTYNSLHRTLGKYHGFLDAIGLKKSIPNGSTMNKFMKSLDKGILESIFPVFRRCLKKNSIVAIDATGLSNFDRSAHYEKRCDDFGHPLPKRTFTKLSLSSDSLTRFIVSARSSAKGSHDLTFTNAHLEDLELMEEKIGHIVADKGYDSRLFMRSIKQRLHCDYRIPIRVSKKNGYSVHGYERNRMLGLMQDKERWISIYGFRSVIESTNFMVKSQPKSNIRERLDENREKRALLTAAAFNVSNSIRLKANWVFTV